MSVYFAFTIHKRPLMLISVTVSKCVIHKKQSLHWYLISESDMIQYACQGKKCSPPSLNPGICPGSLVVYYHWLNGLLESNSRQACIQRRFDLKNPLSDSSFITNQCTVCFIGRRLTIQVWIPACS